MRVSGSELDRVVSVAARMAACPSAIYLIVPLAIPIATSIVDQAAVNHPSGTVVGVP